MARTRRILRLNDVLSEFCMPLRPCAAHPGPYGRLYVTYYVPLFSLPTSRARARGFGKKRPCEWPLSVPPDFLLCLSLFLGARTCAPFAFRSRERLVVISSERVSLSCYRNQRARLSSSSLDRCKREEETLRNERKKPKELRCGDKVYRRM